MSEMLKAPHDVTIVCLSQVFVVLDDLSLSRLLLLLVNITLRVLNAPPLVMSGVRFGR